MNDIAAHQHTIQIVITTNNENPDILMTRLADLAWQLGWVDDVCCVQTIEDVSL